MHSNTLHASRRALSGLCLSAMALALAACGGGSSTAPVAATPAAPAAAPPPLANQLYTQTNETANMVVHLVRNPDGSITLKNRVATGGAGLDGIKPGSTKAAPDSLVSQHSVLVSPDKTTLFAVNGGDGSVSVFAIDQTSGDLTLKKTTRTVGGTPSSLAFNNGVLYVLFQTGADQLGAYAVQADGALAQLGVYALPVPGMTPTQIVISPNNNFVVASSGTASNAVTAFPINRDGTLSAGVTSTKNIANPFAGAFAGPSIYLETDTADKALASYTFDNTGALTLVNMVVAGEGAPCWLSVTPDGKFAFVGNGAGTISAFSVAADGTLALVNAKAAQEPGVLAGVNSVAADSWISADGKFLYVSYLGDDKVVAYSIAGGVLTKLNEQVIGTATKVSLMGIIGI
jgi:6-phosphogluconolactonase (cycloisomerase 2 family)